jgi:ElaB/YqjD/DUF883 family membrane-anchored ribosome-binding protein
MQSRATDAADDVAQASSHAVRSAARWVHGLLARRRELARTVRRRPVTAIGIAFGTGVVVGVFGALVPIVASWKTQKM